MPKASPKAPSTGMLLSAKAQPAFLFREAVHVLFRHHSDLIPGLKELLAHLGPFASSVADKGQASPSHIR